MFQTTQLVGFGAVDGAAAAGATKTYINTASSTSDLTIYDFGNFNAPAAGLMVVGVIGVAPGSRSISTVSIGGTNGTEAVQSAASSFQRGIFARAVSSGNNNVTVTFTGGCSRASVFVWLLEGYSSATAHDTAVNSAIATSTTATLTIPANGACFAVSHASNTNTIAWTNATVDANTTVEALSQSSGASTTSVAQLVDQIVTASGTGSNQRTIAAASWA
jgi:hypothetical protein